MAVKTTTTLLVIAAAGVAYLVYKATQKATTPTAAPSVPTANNSGVLSDIQNYTNAASTIGSKANDLFNLFNSSLQGGGGQS